MRLFRTLFFLLAASIPFTIYAQSDSLLIQARDTKLADTARVLLFFEVTGGLKVADTITASAYFDEAAKVIAQSKLTADLKEQWIFHVAAARATWYCNNNLADTACKIFAQGFDAINSANNQKFLADQMVEAGYVIIGKGRYNEGIEFNTKASEIYLGLKDSTGIGQAYNNVAFMYQQMGISDIALDFYYKSLNIRTAISDYSGMGESYNNLSFEYFNIGELDTALYYADLAIQNREKSGNKVGIAKALNTKGYYLQNAKRYDEAMVYFRRAHNVWLDIDSIGDPRVIYNIGFIHKLQKQLDSTLYYYEFAYEVSRKKHDIYSEIYVLNGLSVISLEREETEQALLYSMKAYELAKTLGSINELKGASLNLSKVYKKKGDFENALFYTTEYYKYRDSLNTTAKQKSVYQQEAKFRFEQNMLALEKEQELKDAVTEANSQRQQLIIIFAVIGLVVVLIFSAFLFNRFRITRRQKDIIEAQKHQVEQQKHEVERQKHMLEEKNTEILDSISYARRLQEAILPPDSLLKRNIPNSFVLYMPKDIVAGDFYWMEKAGDDLFFAVADCTGHGVPGALVSVVCSNALNRAVKEFRLRETGEILDKVRELVIETFEKSESNVMDGMDISLVRFTNSNRQLQWSGANNPLWLIAANEIQEIKADKQPIGKSDIAKPFLSHSVSLENVKALYLFTDGYADQFGGEKGKKFRYKQMEQLLVEIHTKSASDQQRILRERIVLWKGNLEQVDDICVAGIILE